MSTLECVSISSLIAVYCIHVSISSVITMAQYGLLDKWKELYFLKAKCKPGKRYGSGSIFVSHIWLLLAVTAGCLGVCFVVLCLELMMSFLVRFKNRKGKDGFNQ